jgi:hypothetical protein
MTNDPGTFWEIEPSIGDAAHLLDMTASAAYYIA